MRSRLVGVGSRLSASAARKSPADWGRSAGSISSARDKHADKRRGMPGTTRWAGVGVWCSRCIARAISLVPVKGGWPQSAS